MRKSPGYTPVRRGDLVLVTVRNSVTYAGPRGTEVATEYVAGIVTRVTRDGRVKAWETYLDLGGNRFWRSGVRRDMTAWTSDCDGFNVSAADRFALPVREMLERCPQTFATLDAARQTLGGFLAMALAA